LSKDLEERRAFVRSLQAKFAARGDALGWFEALYQESEGNCDAIPWADLEPNKYFKAWADAHKLKGEGRTALVVGCGLGDDARFLHDLGFKVTAFDISPTAVRWAKRLHGETYIQFETADLFQPFRGWSRAFDFVLEVYTIQPLPLEMRDMTIDAIAKFVAPNGRLVVVTRGRDDDTEPDELPWPVSRRELKRFESHGFVQTDFVEMPADDEDEPPRFVVEYVSQNRAQ
jgi:SAM-dependent methyltransferase